MGETSVCVHAGVCVQMFVSAYHAVLGGQSSQWVVAIPGHNCPSCVWVGRRWKARRGAWRGEGGRKGEEEKKGERFRGDRRTASWLHFPFAESPHSLFSFLFCLIQLSEGGSQRDKESFTVQFWKGRKKSLFLYFFKAGILAVLQTDVACHLLVMQQSSRITKLEDYCISFFD